MAFTKFQLIFAAALLASKSLMGYADNTFFVIQTAETPSLNRPGLTPIGKQRAENCIPKIFSKLNVGLIITCADDPEEDTPGGCVGANATVAPLAAKLGITVDVCGTGEDSEDDCVEDKLKAYWATSNKTVLIAWGDEGLDDLLENADIDDEDYDEDSLGKHADVIFTITQGPKSTSVFQTSMNCTGLDGPA